MHSWRAVHAPSNTTPLTHDPPLLMIQTRDSPTPPRHGYVNIDSWIYYGSNLGGSIIHHRDLHRHLPSHRDLSRAAAQGVSLTIDPAKLDPAGVSPIPGNHRLV